MSRKRLSLGIASYGLDKIVVAAIQLLMVPVLANYWGLTLFGIWAMMITIPAFLVLSDFGTVNSALARMTRFVGRDEWEAARVTLHTAWLVTCGICAIACGVIGGLLWWLPEGLLPSAEGFSPSDARLTLLVLLVYGLSTILFRLNTAVFRSTMQYTLSVWCSMGSYALENAGVIIAVVSGADPLTAALVLLVLRLAAIAFVLAVSFRRFPRLAPGFRAASRSELGEMWRPALAASVLGFGLAAYLQGSVVMLGALAGAAAVPAFIAVRTISRLGTQMSTLISIPVAQEFGNALAKEDRHKAGRYFALVAFPAATMALVMGLGLVLLAEPAIRLWTGGVIETDRTLIIFMAVSSFGAILWNPLSNLILVINRQAVFSYANLAISAAGLLVIYGLAGRMGAAAAGLSFALVDLVTLACVAAFIARHWLPDSEFRAGIMSALAELHSALRRIKPLKRRE
ncbi:hypothetical protein [Allopontixanthobacter sp.]|uniref:lipopolysaccharide biosynthesis protein n=1 Tax=Allopontixanthobacter sp. TaxID=2906452 RepID=UPI002AB9797B|nr:hypothetical protein [Allopontixanthobacter sp.]MDZ4307483.1 hypothetical protein [Allopontixanthobacter sp.]